MIFDSYTATVGEERTSRSKPLPFGHMDTRQIDYTHIDTLKKKKKRENNLIDFICSVCSKSNQLSFILISSEIVDSIEPPESTCCS